MNAILIGASGTIGKALSSLLINQGYDVMPASRSSFPSIDIDDPSSINHYFSKITSVEVIICAAGSASFGSLNELSDEQIALGFKSKLSGQINVVRKGLSKLKPNGVIVLTGGMLAYSPWPQTSNIATVNAGLEGFVRAAALELLEGRRIIILHPPLIRETAQEMGINANPWPKADVVAASYLNAIEGKANGEAIFVEGYQPQSFTVYHS